VLYRSVLRGVGDPPDGSLSVNLTDATICGVDGAALVAAEDNPEPISLWKLDDSEKPKPWRYWKLRSADEHKRLRITQDHFYIIRSRERIVLPQGVAVYCRASDETIGEMRIHYAGFVHPFCREHGEQGTPLIFEVRGHNVDVSLLHGERMAKLIFYRMSEDAVIDSETDQSYNDQQLQVSKFFGAWPEKLTKAEDGTLLPGG
jgi:dCTP deaminase